MRWRWGCRYVVQLDTICQGMLPVIRRFNRPTRLSLEALLVSSLSRPPTCAKADGQRYGAASWVSRALVASEGSVGYFGC